MAQTYKRPPITEAVVEVRIGTPIGINVVERVRDRLMQSYPVPPQMLISADIALTEEPTKPTMVRPHVQGYRLTAADGAGLVSIATNFISTSRLAPYEGWDLFIATARANWEIWKRAVGWQKIVRIGVRYLNRIDIPFVDGRTIDIDDYLTFTIRGPSLDLPPIASFAINEVRPLGRDSCQLILNAGLVPSPLVKTISFLLDVDINREVELPQNDEGLWALIDQIRSHKNFVFEGCITDRARELFNR
jgi:uncharacterized protein (TIGR04255 family)